MKLRPIVSGSFAVALLLLVGIGVAWSAGAAYQDTPAKVHNVENETIEVNFSSQTAVDAPGYTLGFYENETVYNSSGAELEEGDDYQFNATTGEVTWYNTAELTDGESASISYSYDAKIRTARALKNVIALPLRLALPAAILIALVVAIAGLAIGLVRLSGGGSSHSTRNFGR